MNNLGLQCPQQIFPEQDDVKTRNQQVRVKKRRISIASSNAADGTATTTATSVTMSTPSPTARASSSSNKCKSHPRYAPAGDAEEEVEETGAWQPEDLDMLSEFLLDDFSAECGASAETCSTNECAVSSIVSQSSVSFCHHNTSFGGNISVDTRAPRVHAHVHTHSLIPSPSPSPSVNNGRGSSDSVCVNNSFEAEEENSMSTMTCPSQKAQEAGVVTFQEDSMAGEQEYTEILIADCDVVLGDLHTPTTGTTVYREVRKRFAKRKISRTELEALKVELLERLLKEPSLRPLLKRTYDNGDFTFETPIRFWFSRKNTSKIQPNSAVFGYLSRSDGSVNRERGAYGLATDKAIQDDVRSAPKATRSRTRFVLNFKKGSMEQVMAHAIEQTQQWVGEDPDKEVYANGFRDDLEYLQNWRDGIREKQLAAARAATNEPAFRLRHLRDAEIHKMHVQQLEDDFVERVKQLWRNMIDRHRQGQIQHKTKSSSSSSIASSSFRKDPDDDDEDDNDDMSGGCGSPRNQGSRKYGGSRSNSGESCDNSRGNQTSQSRRSSQGQTKSKKSENSACQATEQLITHSGSIPSEAIADSPTAALAEDNHDNRLVVAIDLIPPTILAADSLASRAVKALSRAFRRGSSSGSSSSSSSHMQRSTSRTGSSEGSNSDVDEAMNAGGSNSVPSGATLKTTQRRRRRKQPCSRRQLTKENNGSCRSMQCESISTMTFSAHHYHATRGDSVHCESISTITRTTSKYAEKYAEGTPTADPPEGVPDELVIDRKERSILERLKYMFTPFKQKSNDDVDARPTTSVPLEVNPRIAMEDDRSMSSIDDLSCHRGKGSAEIDILNRRRPDEPFEIRFVPDQANAELFSSSFDFGYDFSSPPYGL